MLTKAIIVSKTENNTYMVRIPIFEGNSSGDFSLENSSEAPQYEATLAYSPGQLDSYKVGDIVYVQFEDNEEENVVITGKLYTGETESTGYVNSERVNVTGETDLSSETYIDGVKIGNLFMSKNDMKYYDRIIDSSIRYRILDDSGNTTNEVNELGE